ncbi:ammonium transporter [Dactylosporangium cerinum]|uniref:Ammonium transporter n=1 Tax=Dactylosporangium cerinum TaxID=1434730 RepID=A0ABV9W7I0_9ACTN
MTFDFATMDSGATAWVLACAALVMLMTPAVAFFYGGLVRSKHVLSMMMQGFTVMALVGVVWVVVSYSIAFGHGNAFFGGLRFAGLAHMHDVVPGFVGAKAMVIPPLAFVIFQMMFAVITAALITGSTADRWRFSAFVPFMVLWTLLVYAPIAHWVFSPTGWIATLAIGPFKGGALDFAGGTVVHANAGAAGLAMAIVLGPRRGWQPYDGIRPHNRPFVLLGAALLWFGWFGFNAGSALRPDEVAAYAFINTNTAACAGLLTWIMFERLRRSRPTTIGAASGVVAGLVAITPCAGYVTPLGAVAIGFLAAVAGGAAPALIGGRVDDSLDVFSLHLVAGVVGSLAVGLFASKDVNPAGVNGLFYGGGPGQLLLQFVAVAAVVLYSFGLTLLLGRLLGRGDRGRVPHDHEDGGLDRMQHEESAYDEL